MESEHLFGMHVCGRSMRHCELVEHETNSSVEEQSCKNVERHVV